MNVSGIPVTSAERTFIECAKDLDLVDLVVLGDSLVRAGRTERASLATACHQGRSPGIRDARDAAALVRPHVDSPRESRLRALLVLAGLPEPSINVVLRNPDNGDWVLRLDMAYEAERVAIEYDGRQHAESSSQWHRDIQRREALDRLGWRLVVVTGRDLWQSPEDIIERVRRALRDRGTRVSAHEGWRRHFPVRPAA